MADTMDVTQPASSQPIQIHPRHPENFMKPFLFLLSAAVSVLTWGCAVPAPGPAGDNLTTYRNPDPKIEALHVKAYDYDLGNGVPQDRAKANKLYLQAAKAGDPRSMMNYAINRFSGVGTKADPVDAFRWIDQARFATQFSPDLKMKWRIRGVQDMMRKEMTPAQIKAAGVR